VRRDVQLDGLDSEGRLEEAFADRLEIVAQEKASSSAPGQAQLRGDEKVPFLDGRYRIFPRMSVDAWRDVGSGLRIRGGRGRPCPRAPRASERTTSSRGWRPSSSRPWSVGDLTRQIKTALEELGKIRIEGEGLQVRAGLRPPLLDRGFRREDPVRPGAAASALRSTSPRREGDRARPPRRLAAPNAMIVPRGPPDARGAAVPRVALGGRD
jgi:hypothetical protein